MHELITLIIDFIGDVMAIIDLLKLIVLAIVQGISEILPISSSGHLIICQDLLGMDISNMSLAIFLHIGSLLAVMLYYRKTLISLQVDTFKYILRKDKSNKAKEAFALTLKIVIACIPAGIAGLLLKKPIENIFTNTLFVGINLFITGILLLLLTRKKGTKEIKDMSYFDALKIGLFQMIGILPGISRSGITTIGGKTTKLDDASAINFAFLLFVPIALGTGLLEIIELCNGTLVLSESQIVLYVIGVIVSFMVTYIALITIFKIIKKGKLHYFAYYCFIIALIVIVLHFFRV